jgi:hypothetical protein
MHSNGVSNFFQRKKLTKKLTGTKQKNNRQMIVARPKFDIDNINKFRVSQHTTRTPNIKRKHDHYKQQKKLIRP